jgi:hypothetical protein
MEDVMGWGDCGTDSKGRGIGYYHDAECDQEGCKNPIDRGLSHACGGMHGDFSGCEKYFCEEHLFSVEDPHNTLTVAQLCLDCKHDHYEYLVETLMDDVKEAKTERDEAVEALHTMSDEYAAFAKKTKVLEYSPAQEKALKILKGKL